MGTATLTYTAQPTPDDPPFFFLQISDPQFGMFTADRSFEQETANLSFVIAAANRLRPAFVVVTGDLVNKAGDAAQLAEFRRVTAQLAPDIPLRLVAGNHDVENTPTPATLAAYRTQMGPDYYSFTRGRFAGVVLNSSLIAAPEGAPDEAAAQSRWLTDALAQLRRVGHDPVVVFQHHSWFLQTADEPDDYFNIPRARREDYLARFRAVGVRWLFAGHYHRNALGHDGPIEMVTTGPVGMPLGEGTQSGVRVVSVRDGQISHRFFALGELPTRLNPDGSVPTAQ